MNRHPLPFSSFVMIPLAIAVAACGNNSALEAKQKEVAALRSKVEPLAAPVMIRDGDVAAWISTAPLAAAAATLNAVPNAGRTLSLYANERYGYFWREGDGCFVELNRAMSASGLISNFAVAPQADGSIDLSADVKVDATAPVHAHGQIGCGNGGVGIYPTVTGWAMSPIGLKLTFDVAASGSEIDYALTMTAPPSVAVHTTVNGIPVIGSKSFDVVIAVPPRELFRGKLPLAFLQQGQFDLPASVGSRAYTTKLTNVRFGADAAGIGGAWKADVQFAAAMPAPAAPAAASAPK